ncbi:hypothetical protein GCM10023085_06910 [Actinomadura viridis]|uniref:Uncharacterized protein n=1 Tax=Actinomadura viridis TaxID=58110 RepID=A0A931GQG3_9ACTN|nr:DUF6317 family protein [Actinomadura viridis]MBG6091701.1 hypothetical protein [Actinomadura viridis]
MNGFSAQIDSLVEAGRRFQKVAVDYKGDMPAGGFERPSTGDGKSDAMLETTLKMIDLLHGALADAVWQHGEKLQLVAERYQTAEDENITTLYQAVNEAATIPGDLPTLKFD